MLRQAGLGIHAESLRYSFLCFIPVYLNGRSPPSRNALWDAFLACLAGRSPSAPQEHASGDALQVQYRVTTLCRLSYSNSKSIL